MIKYTSKHYLMTTGSFKQIFLTVQMAIFFLAPLT